MDGILNDLVNSGVGCYMGGVFAGATRYADDLKLLTPSMKALKILATLCEQYAKKIDVLFNGKNSLLIIYKCTRSQPPDPGIVINNVRVPRVDEVILLGRNLRLMQSKFKMNESNVLNILNHKCDNESDAVRLSVQVRELCGWRDKCNCTFLDKVECKTIIDFLYTD